MSFLEKVRQDREDLARVLKKHKGIRKTVEDLYPDNAHFIYELLQNAEDTQATEVSFGLFENGLIFEHNGRPFTEADIWAITDIGEGTKENDDEKIGRFGIGFKSVFAYSETPHIWSPTYSFKISDLVLPTEIESRPDFGQKTRFEFPFNSPKKIVQVAFAEVEAGLSELAETTLLFLSHLESIRWQVGEEKGGEVLRVQHSESHIEILKEENGEKTTSLHFLRFSQPVEGLEKQQVSIAFALDYLPNVTSFDSGKALAKQMKIVPASPGKVAVFFPAEKETSGLRFHIHAPFVPELSRASIKDTPINKTLFDQIASLAAASLHQIRKLELLTGEFLGVLPNHQDTIPLRYQPIRWAVIEEMNNKPLTPTYSKTYAPAKHLLQTKASFKEILTAEDIQFLVKSNDILLQWAIAAAQKNSNADRFLSSLAIKSWDINELVNAFKEWATTSSWQKPNHDFLAWLSGKSIEWHQQLYALLYKELNPNNRFYLLKTISLVRLNNKSYSIGRDCFFPSDDMDQDKDFPRVDKAVYSSGKNQIQQEEARNLLEKIGVQEIGETQWIQLILDQRYTYEAEPPDDKTYFEDFTRFINLFEKEPQKKTLFTDYYMLKCKKGTWNLPGFVFLDSPYLETGLTAFFEPFGDDSKEPLSEQYQQFNIPIDTLRKFVEAIGVQTKLTIEQKEVDSPPSRMELQKDYLYWGAKLTHTGVNEDWFISNLKNLLINPSESGSKLLWRTMRDAGRRVLKAKFRPNQQYETREAPSSLVLMLQEHAWIPQTNGGFVQPFRASRDLLPSGFPFDASEPWLTAIRFGEEELQRSEEQKKKQDIAIEAGFSDVASYERARQFANLPVKDQERILAQHQNKQNSELPDQESRNPERRSEMVGEQAANAPKRITEDRTRSVSIGLEEIKQQAGQYLQHQYTLPDGEMICQICQSSLPFKLKDGSYYFEKVEFLKELERRHYQNYLVLCPNHSAMFQHAHGSRDLMKDMFIEMKGQRLEVVLAQENTTIYFNTVHIADLRKVIDVALDCG